MFEFFEMWFHKVRSAPNSIWQYWVKFLRISEMAKYYKVEINKTEWEVPEKYQMLTPVGSGAYGQVW